MAAQCKPAPAGRSFRVDVFFVPPPRDRRRGAKPKPIGTFTVTAADTDGARAKIGDELKRQYPDRPVRALTSNNRTGGFVAYYNEEGN